MRVSTLLLVLLIFLFVLPGCTFNLEKGYCNILSYSIVDNNGRIGIKLCFDSSGNVTFHAKDPSGEEVDRVFVPQPSGEVSLNLSSYHTNPIDGIYKISVEDAYGNTVETFSVKIEKPTVTIDGVDITWWNDGLDLYYMVEARIHAKNSGSIPVYFDKATISIGDTSLEVKTLENCLLPGYGNITLSLCSDSLPYNDYDLFVTLLDIDDNVIAEGTFQVTPFFSIMSPNEFYGFYKSWKFDGKYYHLRIPLPKGIYNYCSSLPRPYLEDYSFYAIDPKVQGFVEMLAKELEKIYDGNDMIDFVASFAQNIEYRKEEGEYPKYPIELLHDRYGDCEDKAILTSSILYKLGYDVSLIRFEDHMAVGVHLDSYPYIDKVYFTDDSGKRYLYLETSNKGWKLGEADEKYAHDTNYTIYPVKDKPILVQYCKPPVRHQIGDEDFIDLTSTIINIGSGSANNVKLVVKIEVDNSEITVAQSETMYLKEGEGKDVYLKFDTPSFPFSKLFVIVMNNEKEVARSSFVFL